MGDPQPVLQYDSSNSAAWVRYAELETQLADYTRARAIYELGVTQSTLSMPEILWKSYIKFEIDEGERGQARALYERLVMLSGHIKVWISYAKFEADPIRLRREERDELEEEDEEDESTWKWVEGDLGKAREVFMRGYKDLQSKELKEEARIACHLLRLVFITCFWQRFALLKVWEDFEQKRGSPVDIAKVQAMMPVTTKRRRINKETGIMEEGFCVLLQSCFFMHNGSQSQSMNGFSLTMNEKRTRRHSSFCKWHMRGRILNPKKLILSLLVCRV
jgi:crooked neck